MPRELVSYQYPTKWLPDGKVNGGSLPPCFCGELGGMFAKGQRLFKPVFLHLLQILAYYLCLTVSYCIVWRLATEFLFALRNKVLKVAHLC